MRKTRLSEHVYGFSFDYDATAVDDVLDIYNYLMRKNNCIIKYLGLLKSLFFLQY